MILKPSASPIAGFLHGTKTLERFLFRLFSAEEIVLGGTDCGTTGNIWGLFYLSPKRAFGESPKRAPVLFAFSGTPSLHTF